MKQTLRGILGIRITTPPLTGRGLYVHNNVWLVVNSLPDELHTFVSKSVGIPVWNVIRDRNWSVVRECVEDILVQSK